MPSKETVETSCSSSCETDSTAIVLFITGLRMPPTILRAVSKCRRVPPDLLPSQLLPRQPQTRRAPEQTTRSAYRFYRRRFTRRPSLVATSLKEIETRTKLWQSHLLVDSSSHLVAVREYLVRHPCWQFSPQPLG